MTDTDDLLDRFAAAWGRRDAEAVLALMTDDCVYEASVGPEPGQTFAGRDAVARGLAIMFAVDDAASQVIISDRFVAGDRAAWEWRYMAGDGRLLARGCDLFEIRDGKIARKNAFRKASA